MKRLVVASLAGFLVACQTASPPPPPPAPVVSEEAEIARAEAEARARREAAERAARDAEETARREAERARALPPPAAAPAPVENSETVTVVENEDGSVTTTTVYPGGGSREVTEYPDGTSSVSVTATGRASVKPKTKTLTIELTPPEPEAEAMRMAPSSAACIDSPGYATSYDCVDLFFATNREEEASASGQVVFGARADDRTQLGTVTVTVPIARLDKPGSPVRKISNPQKTVSDADRDEFFAIWGWDPQDPDSFRRLVAEELATAEDFENSALVFVHGFNVTFRSAAFRAAQMKFDMRYDGPTFFFSWPANGSTLEYLSDQDDADISVEPLTAFLKLVKDAVGEDTKIFLVAHSMGTRLAAQALNRLAFDPSVSPEEPFFYRSLFAAGDLDRGLFRRWVGSARDYVGELTIYTSSDDKAVTFSRFLRTPGFGTSSSEDEKGRIGLIDSSLGPVIFGDAMTIDITDVNTGLLSNFFGVNHADYVESAVTIADLEALLRDEPLLPEERNPNFVRHCYNGVAYWMYEERPGNADTSCPLP